MSPRSRRALARCVFAVVVGVTLSGCSLNTDIGGPSAIIKVSGDQQSAPVNTVLPTALGVTVVTQFGEVIGNASVAWTIVSGGGSLSANTTLTDAGGNAYVTYTTGPTAGQAVIRASAGNGLVISFTETISP